jgi:hypothetical protein
MKILGYILAALLLLSTAFVGLMGARKAHKLAGDLAEVSEMTKGMSDAQKAAFEEKVGGIPSSGRLNGAAAVGALGGLAALVLLIAAFVKKPAVKSLAIVTVGATALSAILYPYIQTGPMDGAAPRPMALVAIVLAIIGAGGALLASREKKA